MLVQDAGKIDDTLEGNILEDDIIQYIKDKYPDIGVFVIKKTRRQVISRF